MIKNLIALLVAVSCALLLWEPYSFGQSQALSGTSLIITGSSSLNTLEVTGTATMRGNLTRKFHHRAKKSANSLV